MRLVQHCAAISAIAELLFVITSILAKKDEYRWMALSVHALYVSQRRKKVENFAYKLTGTAKVDCAGAYHAFCHLRQGLNVIKLADYPRRPESVKGAVSVNTRCLSFTETPFPILDPIPSYMMSVCLPNTNQKFGQSDLVYYVLSAADCHCPWPACQQHR